ncbi:MAG TPA: LysE family transporter [Candidatus Baltobacteraceae bacterium]|nr:LysE family transporter [Candidatus Baltobacteraceae bacterium]
MSGWLLGLAIALPVGPLITELIRRGLAGGFWKAWQVGLGAAASHVILVALTLLGVITLLDSPFWHVLLGITGVLVLGWLGVQAIRTGAASPATAAAEPHGHPFAAGFAIGIGNPITLLWFLTAGGALIMGSDAGRSAGLAVAFGASFVCGVLCWDTVMAALSGFGRRWMRRGAVRALNLIAGVVFWGFAVRLFLRLLTYAR